MSDQDQTYNGWEGLGDRESAWATWNVALWIDNDEHLYKMRRRRVFLNGDDVEEFCRMVFPSGTADMDDPSEMNNVSYDEIYESWEAEDEPEPIELTITISVSYSAKTVPDQDDLEMALEREVRRAIGDGMLTPGGEAVVETHSVDID